MEQGCGGLEAHRVNRKSDRTDDRVFKIFKHIDVAGCFVMYKFRFTTLDKFKRPITL